MGLFIKACYQPSQSARDCCPAVSVGGGERDFSHSFMKSDAVFFRLLGVSLFSTGGRYSSRLIGAGVEAVAAGDASRSRVPGGVLLLSGC
jgi:hypothetical protein